MDSFKVFEAATLQAGIGAPPTDNIDNDDDGDDGEEWEFENVRKRFWDGLSSWAKSSPAANMIRFNIYGTILEKVRPKAHSMIWGPQGDGIGRKLVKARKGYAKAYLEWRMEMDGMLWDSLLEQQRSVLAKSDVYKAFGNAGQVGSAALLFKGDVLECVVFICCALMPQEQERTTTGMVNTVNSYGFGKPNKFIGGLTKLVQSKYGTKLESWLKQKIVSKMRAALVVSNVRGNDLTLPNLKLTSYETAGHAQAYDGGFVIKFDVGYRMQF